MTRAELLGRLFGAAWASRTVFSGAPPPFGELVESERARLQRELPDDIRSHVLFRRLAGELHTDAEACDAVRAFAEEASVLGHFVAGLRRGACDAWAQPPRANASGSLWPSA